MRSAGRSGNNARGYTPWLHAWLQLGSLNRDLAARTWVDKTLTSHFASGP